MDKCGNGVQVAGNVNIVRTLQRRASVPCQFQGNPRCAASAGMVRRLSATAILVLCLISGPVFSKAATAPTSKLAHGFLYLHDEVREKPWSIHIVKVDRSNPDFELHTTLGKGNRFGLGTLSAQVRTLPPEIGRPVAAINGDYYYRDYPYVGDPKGLQILQGELVSGPCDWTCFWMDAARTPHMTNVVSRFEVTWPSGQKMPIGLNEERASDAAVLYTAVIGPSTRTRGGRELILEPSGTNVWLPLRAGQLYSARVREVREAGDTPLTKDIMVLSLGRQLLTRVPKLAPSAAVQISTATWPDLNGAKTAIGGGPPIVRAGRVIGRDDPYVRHPRSAFGWNKDYFFFVEVDGRQRNLSVGMTVPELANYMARLGCDEAMCFDGGGSATCWVYGQVMNSPSEGRERAMANALVLVQKEKR